MKDSLTIQGAMPTRPEFLQLLQEAADRYDPVEKLLSMEREFVELERTYAMSSSEFYRRFSNGELGDTMDFIRWAGRYELYLRLKEMISTSLEAVVTETRLAYA